MKTLSELLSQMSALTGELAKLESSEPKLIERRQKLLADLDIDADPPAALTKLTVQLESLPLKRTQIEGKTVELEKEFPPAIEGAVRKLTLIARTEEKELSAELFAVLQKFIPDLAQGDHLISEVMWRTERYQRIAQLGRGASSYIYGLEDKAKEIVQTAERFNIDLDKLPEVPPYVPPVNLGYDSKTGKAIQPGYESTEGNEAEAAEQEAIEENETVSQS